jgi:hypothetical protein
MQVSQRAKVAVAAVVGTAIILSGVGVATVNKISSSSPDVKVEKTVLQKVASPGGDLRYVIVVTNHGPGNARG